MWNESHQLPEEHEQLRLSGDGSGCGAMLLPGRDCPPSSELLRPETFLRPGGGGGSGAVS